ncbi:hypothetical protein V5O48_012644 [Marasmius crinis-equi]|uniref:F-box domain-containing protein n=1 Tax=Marasmius crinis-equi TaxID=585013 RepID=A0ABR3F2T1_9AGAR
MLLPEELTDAIFQFSTVDSNVLRTSKSFCRIGLPHVYHCVQAKKGKDVPLKHAGLIRKLIVGGTFGDEALALLRAVGKGLKELDIELVDEELSDDFLASLRALTGLTRLTIRKSAPSPYLSQQNIKQLIHALADNIQNHWRLLEVVQVDTKLSEPSPSPASPITHLAHALASLPKLHSFHTPLPSLFTDIFLTISASPSLARICLAKDGQGIMPTGLFMSGVVKHPRLLELVRAGTPIIRHRAQTLQFIPNTPVPTTKPQPQPQPHPHNTRVLQRRWSIPPTH